MTPVQIPPNDCAPRNIRVYFNAVKAVFYPVEQTGEDGVGRSRAADGPVGVTLKHVNNLNNLGMCCNSWKRVGLINMKRAAGLVTATKLNYSD